MLVEKKILNSKIVVFKLVSGEEVIARMVEDHSQNGGTISVKNPLSLIMTNEDSGQGMVAFVPWILGANDDIPLSVSMAQIVVLTEAREDAATQYSQAIGETTESAPKISPVQSFGGRRGRGGRG